MTMSRAWHDLLSALGLLSRLPLPAHSGRGAEAAWAYPLAGAVLGALAGLTGMIALGIGLGAEAAAVITLGVSVMLTGALHEDGLADCADGLWGSHLRERRLEIMKDSRTGAYGVIALVLGLLARWIGLSALLAGDHAWLAIVGIAAVSRGTMPALMATLPHARSTGLSHAIGKAPPICAALAALIGGCIAVLCLGVSGIIAIFIAALAALIIARIAIAKIGGQTGDVLGATQQISEIALLLALTA
ncbi:adenosylcobinamide-GDP ribazoletransferase [Pseudooceanicola sediminis]|uniref:Adenosylcobinamide-GDP ribazoletransferase n=1 Tax=Pseudooceanicola sediminis TaxID=2211117 RepID=A0A399J5H7_9RHOB|nr:adenosylcobinamide-GDP ribazoletransferase [Pseudooceanicola sediminis]KAA2312066.1 adenosylcobinamide-GDP ribazoletransferase [Puniceibacterium sp. HSS470]RII38076.1 adenosylcobinamide-GDP ribazoletransferase [Pseudooceanicola sediminis]|tara:strand:- start:12162 stop:12899 length:738 start_codon:yes stop_codon:yes gene_type:complete